jgi:serine/threonine protein kinase
VSAAEQRTSPLELGNYELLAELASGGMATLYIARQVGLPGLERLVVIKRVHPHLLRRPKFTDMFRDEARVASLVRHPNVVHLLDVIDSDGELLLVLEYIESVPLSLLLREVHAAGARLPVAVSVRIVADLLAGLHAAHEAKDVRGKVLDVVHRDVSPQNVIVGVDGQSRLIDFGIAKAAERMTETTTGGLLKGKLAYMSPEQARGATIDRRSDLFSAGIVLYEAVTGERLFQNDAGENSNALLGILLDPIDDPSTKVPGIPKELDAVVQKALERVRDERFQTAVEFQDALQEAVRPALPREVTEAVECYCGAAIASRREELARIFEGTAPRVKIAPKDVPLPKLSLDVDARAQDASTKTDPVSSQQAPFADAPQRRRASRSVTLGITGFAVCVVAVVAVARHRPGVEAATVELPSRQPAATEPSDAPHSTAPPPTDVASATPPLSPSSIASTGVPPRTPSRPHGRPPLQPSAVSASSPPSQPAVPTPARSTPPPPTDLHTENPY